MRGVQWYSMKLMRAIVWMIHFGNALNFDRDPNRRGSPLNRGKNNLAWIVGLPFSAIDSRKRFQTVDVSDLPICNEERLSWPCQKNILVPTSQWPINIEDEAAWLGQRSPGVSTEDQCTFIFTSLVSSFVGIFFSSGMCTTPVSTHSAELIPAGGPGTTSIYLWEVHILCICRNSHWVS